MEACTGLCDLKQAGEGSDVSTSKSDPRNRAHTGTPTAVPRLQGAPRQLRTPSYRVPVPLAADQPTGLNAEPSRPPGRFYGSDHALGHRMWF